MQDKKHYIESIKNLYFEHKCNSYFYSYDGEEFPGKNSIIKIIRENEVQWSHEFQEIKKNKMLSTNNYYELLELHFSFLYSLKSFDDMYELITIFAEIILKREFDFSDLFFYFYELILFCYKQYFNENLFKFNNILEYYKKNNNKKYDVIISYINRVLAKDKFKETDNKELVKKILKLIK